MAECPCDELPVGEEKVGGGDLLFGVGHGEADVVDAFQQHDFAHPEDGEHVAVEARQGGGSWATPVVQEAVAAYAHVHNAYPTRACCGRQPHRQLFRPAQVMAGAGRWPLDDTVAERDKHSRGRFWNEHRVKRDDPIHHLAHRNAQ